MCARILLTAYRNFIDEIKKLRGLFDLGVFLFRYSGSFTFTQSTVAIMGASPKDEAFMPILPSVSP